MILVILYVAKVIMVDDKVNICIWNFFLNVCSVCEINKVALFIKLIKMYQHFLNTYFMYT